MAFFDKIGEKISSKSKDVAVKAKEMVDVAGLNSSIASEESKIAQAYKDIGVLYYEMKKEQPDSEFTEFVEIITQANIAIEGYRKEINQIKGLSKCSNCGAELTGGTLFCGSCGFKNEQIAAESEVEESVEEVTEKFCPSCNAKIEDETAFCTGCGEKIS